MVLASTRKAKRFFDDKMDFTTGPAELNEMLMGSHDDINIVDVRNQEDYAKGHIPEAINLPKERWGNPIGLSKDRLNVVYCYSEVCHLAAGAARNFAQQGYPVMELEGGFEGWQQHNMPIES